MTKENIEAFVKNSQLVTDYFGYWPTFHDDYIDNFSYAYREREVGVTVRSEVETKKGNVCNIIIALKGVKELQLGNDLDVKYDFNVIFGFGINKLDMEGLFEATFDSSVGLYCKVKCKEVVVEDLKIKR